MDDRERILDVYKRFLAEAKAMINNNQKNIVKFKQALRDSKGDLYIIMDLCDGGDLY